MNIFIFGTLMDKALLEIVLGRKVELVSATLKDYGVFKVMDADYPVMIKSVGLVANGIILNELTKMDILRTDFYEHIFDYFLKPVLLCSLPEPLFLLSVCSRLCHAFLPPPSCISSSSLPWPGR